MLRMFTLLKRLFKLIFKLAVFVLILGAVLVAGVNGLEYLTQNGKILNADEIVQSGKSYDCIMVLGASVNADGTPSVALQDRLDTAIALYNAGVSDRIIMSGDDKSDKDYDEVTAMKAYAVAQGVPSSAIFCDHAGLNTYDSMYRAKNVFGAQHMIVVTQHYHLVRALWDANRLGVRSVGADASLHEYDNMNFYRVREFCARASDFYKVVSKQTATMLSEPVSLDQSGDVTSW